MGLFSKLLGELEDPLEGQARTLLPAAEIHAASSYLPLQDRFPVVGTVLLEQWNFFVTVAGVFIAATRLNNLGFPEIRENRLMDTVTRDLDAWNGDGVRAFDDCKAFFDHEDYDRLAAVDPQFVTADTLGMWIVWNALGRRPTTDEELGLVRAIGTLTTQAFFRWWDG